VRLGLIVRPNGPLPLPSPEVIEPGPILPPALAHPGVLPPLLLSKPLPGLGGCGDPLSGQVLLSLTMAFAPVPGMAACSCCLVLQPLLG